LLHNRDGEGIFPTRKEEPLDYERHFASDPGVCGGQPVIAGTRIPVRTVLASLAEGASFEEILADFPTLSEEDLRAVVAFAATAAQEDLPIPAIPSVP